MLYLILALVALGLISAIFGIISQRKGEDEEPLQEGVSCNTCNGENSKCEQECMMEAATKEIEYYDDEELDRFAGRAADNYTDEEVEEFSEVLYTMQPEEVAGWNRSLILRGINLPNQIKDEVISFLSQTYNAQCVTCNAQSLKFKVKTWIYCNIHFFRTR